MSDGLVIEHESLVISLKVVPPRIATVYSLHVMQVLWRGEWHIQDIHKRMVRFQKLLKCVFLIPHGRHKLSAAETVHVSYALPAVCLSCLLRGRGTSFQDGVAAGEGFMCAPF
jgi:hypothetical protein